MALCAVASGLVARMIPSTSAKTGCGGADKTVELPIATPAVSSESLPVADSRREEFDEGYVIVASDQLRIVADVPACERVYLRPVQQTSACAEVSAGVATVSVRGSRGACS